MDLVEHGEKVEALNDAFIAQRDRQRRREEGERPEHEAYAESVRRYEERQVRREWWEKLRYHESMIRSHTANFEAITDKHRREVARCEEMLGIAELGELSRNGHHTENGHKKGAA